MSPSMARKPYRPWWGRLVNTTGHVLNRVGLHPLRLDEADLRGRAMRKTGLSDFGEESIHEATRVLVRSFEDEYPATLLTRIFARRIMLRRLCNRLRIEATIAAEPTILDQVIAKPLFILGLPRAGTTLLHRLLAEDPANRVPLLWEMDHPVPPPEVDSYETDDRIALTEREYATLNMLMPNFKAIHELGARLPEECLALMANDLMSISFLITLDLPSYRQWLMSRDLTQSYALHKRQLQLLQYRNRRERWVLKAPWHLWGLQWLLQIYPDARIVYTHRDPVKVVLSSASLITTMREVFCDCVSPVAVGEEVVNQLCLYLDRAAPVRQHAERDPASRSRFTDVHYQTLITDPIGTIQRIYKVFDIELTESTEQRMRNYLKENYQHKHGTHRYTLEQFGLDESAVRHRFAQYCSQYGVEPEA